MSLQSESDQATHRVSAVFSLEGLEALANQFAAEHIDSYLAELESGSFNPARKEINDALWGTIGLTPIEVALLDSPLLQRLRYIRQLGVVHWVYPGAIHTRFEHTLGVLFQIQHLTSALNALVDVGPSPLISPSLVQLLRVCALLHDIGHPAFSHVSETAAHGLPAMSTISAEFSRKKHVENRQLSEIFAYYVVRSSSMRRLLDFLLDRCGTPISIDRDRGRNLDRVIDMIACAIIGMKIDDRMPLLHELISGPFDADKLDYFVRDARMAGTPSVLDISRLVQKLAVRGFPSTELPREIASNVAATTEKHYLFGIKWSGVALLDELHLARVLLYAKIYRHPKVVAIEQMLRAAILTLGRIANIQDVLQLLYSHPDDVLLNMSAQSLAAALKIDLRTLDEEGRERLCHATKLLKAIRDRRLWVRAFGLLQRRYPSDPLERDEDQKHGLISFREEVEHPQGVEKFRAILLDEVDEILRLTFAHANPPNRTQLESLVMIYIQGQTPGSSQIARAYLMPPTGAPLPFREYVVNRAVWANSYSSDQPAGFIFCPFEIADAVYLAVEKLIRIHHNVRLPQSALEVSKRDPIRIQELKQRLREHGYYRGSPYDLRPTPKRLTRADVEPAAGAIATIVSRYLEPTSPDAIERAKVDPLDRVTNWLRQFDDDQHIDCALRIMRRFRMLTRDDTTNAIKQFIDANPMFLGARVIPFGAAKDSAAISAYFAADIQGTYISECTTLADAAKSSSATPIIFIDDFVGSGNQGADILVAGFGIQELRKDLGEQRSFFGDIEIELLKRVKVGFVFTAAWDDGIKEVEAAAVSVGIDAVVFRLIDEDSIPFAFNEIDDDVAPEVMETFKTRCAEIGSQLIAIKEDGSPQNPEKIDLRKLGYGNRAMLLASPFNVPSQTLTAIWATGVVDNVPWSPLMVRRKKH